MSVSQSCKVLCRFDKQPTSKTPWLQTGYLGVDGNESEGVNGGEFKDGRGLDVDEATSRVIAAIDAITLSGRSLFTLAVLSGKPGAVHWVYRLIVQYFAGPEVHGQVGSTLERSNLHQEVRNGLTQYEHLRGFVCLIVLLLWSIAGAQSYQCRSGRGLQHLILRPQPSSCWGEMHEIPRLSVTEAPSILYHDSRSRFGLAHFRCRLRQMKALV